MDTINTNQSSFSERNGRSVLSFLDRKYKSKSDDTVSVYSVDLDTAQDKPDRIRPRYSFNFGQVHINEHVEYEVLLVEEYTILRRTIRNQYSFRTRYSMLEVLAGKLGLAGFPGKKIFGNKSPSFLAQRKVELEEYLNRAARKPAPALLAFLKQIKDSDFNSSLAKPFSLG